MDEYDSADSASSSLDGAPPETSPTATNAYNLKTLPVWRHKDRVFLIKGVDLTARVDTAPFMVTLRHPRLGSDARYLIANKQLLEVQACRNGPVSSWFIDETVLKDGRLYLATPVDPLFLLIPRLEELRKQSSESAGVFVESLHIVQDPPCVDGKYLCERHLDHIDLALLCDIKQTASVTAVRLNDDKVLDWLTAKVLAVFAVLRDTPSLALLCKPADDTAAVVDTFRPTSDDVHVEVKRDHLAAAVAFVAEYVTPARADALARKFAYVVTRDALPLRDRRVCRVEREAATQHPLTLARKMEHAMAPQKTSSLIEEVRAATAARLKEAAKRTGSELTRSQKQLEKVNKRGMASMTSFFKVVKKAKKSE